jgi:hypothetical protein
MAGSLAGAERRRQGTLSAGDADGREAAGGPPSERLEEPSPDAVARPVAVDRCGRVETARLLTDATGVITVSPWSAFS